MTYDNLAPLAKIFAGEVRLMFGLPPEETWPWSCLRPVPKPSSGSIRVTLRKAKP